MTSEENRQKQAETAEKSCDKAEQQSGCAGCKDSECAEGEKCECGGCGENAEAGADETPNASEAKQPEQSPEDEALNAKYLRLMADFQNFKRRTEKEKNDIYVFANEKIVKELLDVIDNFERALSVGAGADGEKFLEGMEMILKQLLGVLEKAGVSEIKCLGEDFDPNFHNAVMTEDSTEYESGKVTAVLQKGYVLNGRVVRPSMVKVSN